MEGVHFVMHEDAEQRIMDFVQRLDRPRSVAARIEEMLPVIEEGRARGATWPEIADVLGIPRSTLLAAYTRAKRKSGGRKSAIKVANKTETAAQPADLAAQDTTTKSLKTRKVDRWSG